MSSQANESTNKAEDTSKPLPLPAPSGWPNFPYLRGNYGPVFVEHSKEVGRIEGSVPPILKGSIYCRNGPNPHFAPVQKHHWFDGDGMLHAVRFADDGSVFYRNRWIRTESFKYEESIGKGWFLSLADFSTLSGIVGVFAGVVRKSLSPFVPRSLMGPDAVNRVASNTSIIFHDRRLLALVENAAPHWVAAKTLDSLGEYNYNGKLNHAFTAHPKICPLTNEMFAFGYAFDDDVKYFRVLANGDKQNSIAIKLKDGRRIMMHDFAHTRNHVVFLDYPYTFDLTAIVRGSSPLAFRPELGARIGVLKRDAVDAAGIRWFNVKSGFAFHVAASWEIGTKITVIVCLSENFQLDALSDSKKKIDKKQRLYRYDIDLALKDDDPNAVVEREISATPGEFPVVDEQNRWGYVARYIWFAGMGEQLAFDRIVKHDLLDNSQKTFLLPANCYADEFVFVNANATQYKGDYDPAKNDESPDDNGYLLGYVYDAAKQTSSLYILNASSMTCQCKIDLGARVPHGFHGKLLLREQIESERAAN